MNKRPLEIDRLVDHLDESAVPVVQKLSEASQQLEVTLRPFVQELARMSQSAAPYIESLAVTLRPFVQEITRISQAIAPHIESIRSYAKSFERYSRFVDSVGATGWLPYHTVPISYVEECGGNTPLLEQRLSSFYETNWNEIRQDIESRLEAYHVDEEARETFREALSAHEAGFYRCVCRVLFPEIERMIRILFFEDKAGTIPSKEMLNSLTHRGSLKDFMPREAYGWILFGRLVAHLYAPVTEKNRKKFQKDFVPNRHASIHGRASYSTHKHSMNMIIMADYIFQVLPSIK